MLEAEWVQVGSGQRSAELTAHEAPGTVSRDLREVLPGLQAAVTCQPGTAIVVLICSCSVRRHRARSREMAANPENIDTIVSLMSLKAF